MNDSPNQLFPILRSQSRRYVEHLFKCEICRVHNGLTIVQVVRSHEYCWFHCYSHEHSPNHRMFFFIFCNICNVFCLFRTSSFTRFTNDIDSTDNSNSASSFPMTNCWGHAFSWESISGRPDLPRGITSFTTDCAVPSWRFSSWENQVEFLVSLNKKFHRVAPIARTSQYQFSTLEKTKLGRHPTLSSLLKRSFP